MHTHAHTHTQMERQSARWGGKFAKALSKIMIITTMIINQSIQGAQET